MSEKKLERSVTSSGIVQCSDNTNQDPPIINSGNEWSTGVPTTDPDPPSAIGAQVVALDDAVGVRTHRIADHLQVH